MRQRKRKRVRTPNDVHTIESFCEANGISARHYFELKRQGLGPREMKVGKRVLISPQAEADWRRERENADK